MFFPCKIPVFCSVFYVCPLVLHVGIQNLHFFALSPPRFGLGAHEVIGDGHFQGVSRELDVAIPAGVEGSEGATPYPMCLFVFFQPNHILQTTAWSWALFAITPAPNQKLCGTKEEGHENSPKESKRGLRCSNSSCC